MKRTPIKALVILVAVSFVACLQSTESSFFRSFSLRKLVAENRSYAGLECGTGGGGGGSSNAVGAWGLGGGSKEFHSDKGDACLCIFKPGAEGAFDEVALMAGLAQDVEKAITSSGSKIIEKGNSDSSSFYFVYALDNTKGRVQISGKKVEADQYSLQAKLEESGKVKSW